MTAKTSRISPSKRRPHATVAIRGRGRAGKALARALRSAGISVRWLPRKGRRGASRPIGIVILAVPDDAIDSESERLVGAGHRARLAMHLSGARGAETLSAWRRTGAFVASFHPLGSFSGAHGESAAGHSIAIEGDPRAVVTADRLARAIGARPWRIDPAFKALYHAAATAAAGGTATLVAQAARAAETAGMPPEDALRGFAALAEEAAENVARRGFPAGLTGPLARGDAGTLQLHRRALARHPALAAAYRVLAKAAAGDMKKRARHGKARRK